ncbi:MAG: 6,7-dimethyl-8-ribityllumazine synthase [Flavobacteriales bacterium]|nr:6,7-dimethyl-8-ribityllumazine synthase [Flavobacteriales bacterium]
MSSKDKNLSEFRSDIPSGRGFKVGIVWSEWNEDITGPMRDGAIAILLKAGVKKEDILIRKVPGTFELPLAAQEFAEKKSIDGVICIGCVIQGETKHFDFICLSAANGIMEVNLKFGKPVMFGVITTNNLQQAIDRSGGVHGNKGEEAAYSLLMMLN